MGIEFKDFKPESPREEAKKISSGKVNPHFIGPKSKEVKKQELVSHIQNFQETFSNHELKVWKEKLKALSDELA